MQCALIFRLPEQVASNISLNVGWLRLISQKVRAFTPATKPALPYKLPKRRCLLRIPLQERFDQAHPVEVSTGYGMWNHPGGARMGWPSSWGDSMECGNVWLVNL